MSLGTIYLVGTPIGNLEDVTYRAVRILKEVDLIAAEDTRHTQKLLSHYGITTPQISYHEHNELKRASELVRLAKEGKTIAVVADAGMPGVSDPGFRIVRSAIEAGVPLEVIPGPSSIVSALVVSGMPTDRFVFEGFVPPKKTARRKRLFELSCEERTVIFFESAKRLVPFLEDVETVLGNREIVMVRELTKIYETVLRASIHEMIVQLQNEEIKGECIVLVSGKAGPLEFENLSPEKLIDYLTEKMSLERMEAIKLTAHLLGVSKKTIYKKMLG